MLLFLFIQETKMRLNVILPSIVLFLMEEEEVEVEGWGLDSNNNDDIYISIYIYREREKKTRKGKKKRKADAECFAWWVTYNAPSCPHFLDSCRWKNVSI